MFCERQQQLKFEDFQIEKQIIGLFEAFHCRELTRFTIYPKFQPNILKNKISACVKSERQTEKLHLSKNAFENSKEKILKTEVSIKKMSLEGSSFIGYLFCL